MPLQGHVANGKLAVNFISCAKKDLYLKAK